MEPLKPIRKVRSIIYPPNVRWKCVRCTMCCGDTPQRRRIIRALRVEVEEIAKKTGRQVEDFAFLLHKSEPYSYAIRKRQDGKCLFLVGNSCGIYLSRPLTCRFYPFSVNKHSTQTYEFQVTEEECPGLGHGEKIGRNSFVKLLKIAEKRLSHREKGTTQSLQVARPRGYSTISAPR